MFATDHEYSMVTAVLPERSGSRVLRELLGTADLSAWLWKARGTQLQDRWLQRFVPVVSPTKNMFQLLLPNHEVEEVVARIIEASKLHLQATGAVFSTPCDHAYFGSEFSAWRGRQDAPNATTAHDLRENLSVIYCVVAPSIGERVAKAAIKVGAHGPIVYYSEGRGIRDRLGWLRITKEADKEVVMVLADEADVEQVFDAMAKAGGLHQPGRGFMYRLAIDKGMFNLPSRISNHHYSANVQQIISAIDGLTGHSHWRDQSVFEVGNNGKAVGVGASLAKLSTPAVDEPASNPVCLSAVVKRDDAGALTNLLLDAGAPGLNLNYSRYLSNSSGTQVAGATIDDGYALLRCVTDREAAEKICLAINDQAETAGILDLAVLTNEVQRVATYVPNGIELRRAPRPAAMAG